jgi:cytochrome P450
VLAQLQREVDTKDGEAYATATIQETLRRRPVLPITAPRYVERPVEIGGWSYQPGVSLAANAYLLHHDPDIYPDPYSFRPERFLETPPGTYIWIPFGGGRRRCLGASFAQLEMRVVLAEVLRRYELCASASGPELARRRNITVRPHLGTRVRLAARERDQVA